MTGTPIQRLAPVWLLIPHALSVACFAAASIWMSIVQTNRSDPDLYLAIIGYASLAIALLATIVAFWRVLPRPETRRAWPWLLAHVAGLVLAAWLGSNWIGSHLA